MAADTVRNVDVVFTMSGTFIIFMYSGLVACFKRDKARQEQRDCSIWGDRDRGKCSSHNARHNLDWGNSGDGRGRKRETDAAGGEIEKDRHAHTHTHTRTHTYEREREREREREMQQ